MRLSTPFWRWLARHIEPHEPSTAVVYALRSDWCTIDDLQPQVMRLRVQVDDLAATSRRTCGILSRVLFDVGPVGGLEMEMLRLSETVDDLYRRLDKDVISGRNEGDGTAV